MKEIEILARAVVLDGSYFLLVRSKGAANTFLPGGHVRPGEAMAEALARELDEELGVTCRVGPYLGAVEHSWQDASGANHEINHCFVVDSDRLAHSSDPTSKEPQLEFHWVHEADLEAWNLMPGPVGELIRRLIRGERDAWWGTTLPTEKDSPDTKTR